MSSLRSVEGVVLLLLSLVVGSKIPLGPLPSLLTSTGGFLVSRSWTLGRSSLCAAAPSLSSLVLKCPGREVLRWGGSLIGSSSVSGRLLVRGA